MIVYNTKDAAEEAKMTDTKYNSGDMIVKVEGGFAIMSAKDYISWLLQR